CSNPAPINTNKHQNTMISLATSLVVRNEHHTARHTSQFARMPRANAARNGRFILACAVFSMNVRCGSLANAPDSASRAANAIEPARLPSSDHPHRLASWVQPILLANLPNGIVMALPVNSSEPATNTRLNATPKLAPMTSFVNGDCAAASGA